MFVLLLSPYPLVKVKYSRRIRDYMCSLHIKLSAVHIWHNRSNGIAASAEYLTPSKDSVQYLEEHYAGSLRSQSLPPNTTFYKPHTSFQCVNECRCVRRCPRWTLGIEMGLQCCPPWWMKKKCRGTADIFKNLWFLRAVWGPHRHASLRRRRFGVQLLRSLCRRAIYLLFRKRILFGSVHCCRRGFHHE